MAADYSTQIDQPAELPNDLQKERERQSFEGKTTHDLFIFNFSRNIVELQNTLREINSSSTFSFLGAQGSK